MDHSTLVMTQNDKHEQHAEPNRRDNEKINSNGLGHMIPDEGSPGLRCWFRPVPMQQSRYGPFRQFDAKLYQFTMNLGGPPRVHPSADWDGPV